MSEVLGQEECLKQYQHLPQNFYGLYCQPVWDGVLCWPATEANASVYLPCPSELGLDTTKLASRRCGPDGKWEGNPQATNKATSEEGWSNYMECFTKEMKVVLHRLYNSSTDEAEAKMQIAKSTRIVEMLGLIISMLALMSSLVIFFRFSSLKNRRNHLHKNLFSVMLAQVVIRLTLYTDQLIVRVAVDNPISSRSYVISIEKSPVVCELFYVLLEYSRTAVFIWMFLEGVHLHSNVSVVFPSKVRLVYFHLVGWGTPTILVLIWVSVMATKYTNRLCWWGYPMSIYFWILEGPRMAVVLINTAILLNIVCVIANRVQSSNSEIQQIRKAVRATLLLLPLLGIPNLLDIVPAPLERSPLQFAIWSYTTHIMSSSQGFFIAFLYCFLNREVQQAVRRQYITCLTNSYVSS